MLVLLLLLLVLLILLVWLLVALLFFVVVGSGIVDFYVALSLPQSRNPGFVPSPIIVFLIQRTGLNVIGAISVV